MNNKLSPNLLNMWKDFFYFSKGQRVGIIVLILLIVIVIVLNNNLQLFYPDPSNNHSEFVSEVKSFKESLLSRDSIRQLEWQKMSDERRREYEEKYEQFQPQQKFEKVKYSLFSFDPNKLDSIGFVKLGLKPYIASNILKYRRNGGTYSNVSDFSKVYGIRPDKFLELKPYISIAQIKDNQLNRTAESTKSIIVELNSADTTLLMQVKGIGRGYAKGIVRFRNQAGGFISVEQLKDIYGMRPENFERIKSYCTANKNLVRKIVINTATVEKLQMHPYINFYQAKAIYELRRKKGRLKRLEDLIEISDLSAENIEKIKPYISFE